MRKGINVTDSGVGRTSRSTRTTFDIPDEDMCHNLPPQIAMAPQSSSVRRLTSAETVTDTAYHFVMLDCFSSASPWVVSRNPSDRCHSN
jgi:hypothetical protein